MSRGVLSGTAKPPSSQPIPHPLSALSRKATSSRMHPLDCLEIQVPAKDQRQDDRHPEQDLRDVGGAAGDPSKAEGSRYQRYDQQNQSPAR